MCGVGEHTTNILAIAIYFLVLLGCYITNVILLLFGLQELQDRMAKAKDYTDEIINLRKEIVDFHGEMVLLENYSALNYTGNLNSSLR